MCCWVSGSVSISNGNAQLWIQLDRIDGMPVLEVDGQGGKSRKTLQLAGNIMVQIGIFLAQGISDARCMMAFRPVFETCLCEFFLLNMICRT